MAVNKVVINGETKIDITDTTATDSDVANGKVFYAANGEKTVGTLVIGEITKEAILQALGYEEVEIYKIDDNGNKVTLTVLAKMSTDTVGFVGSAIVGTDKSSSDSTSYSNVAETDSGFVLKN